jgi:hypothetical protein
MEICMKSDCGGVFPNIHIDGTVDKLILNFERMLPVEGATDCVCSDKRADLLTNSLLSNLDHLSWGEINRIGILGKARETFALGATKHDKMKNGFVAVWQIIGFNHDDLADGSGKAPISWDLVTVYKERWEMNDENTNKGGWEACKMNRRLNSEFFDLCSDELQAIIKPVIKLTSAGGCSKEIIKSVCKLWLKSEKELYGRCFYSVPGEGHWYEYYRQEDVPYYKEDADGERVWQALRSANYNNTGNFCHVNTDGSAASNYAGNSLALAPGFSC